MESTSLNELMTGAPDGPEASPSVPSFDGVTPRLSPEGPFSFPVTEVDVAAAAPGLPIHPGAIPESQQAWLVTQFYGLVFTNSGMPLDHGTW